MCKISDCWSTDMLNFDFSKKEQILVSPQYFVYDFSRKTLLKLYSINWPNFIVWLSLLLEIFGNISTVVICFPINDVLNFELTLLFKSSHFTAWPQNSETKILMSQIQKEHLRWHKKYFSTFLKNCWLPEIVYNSGVGI